MTQWGLDALFNPSKRHMDEEKQRLQSTREEIGDASGGKRIDLESGKVVIRRKADADAASQSDADADADADGNGDANVATDADIDTEAVADGTDAPEAG